MDWLLASRVSHNIVGGSDLEITDMGLFTIFDTHSNPAALLKCLLFPALPLVGMAAGTRLNPQNLMRK